jgi:TPR repeat protein
MKTIIRTALLAALALSSASHAGEFCGKIENHYGPFDYRTDKDKLPIVEHAHFTEEVEQGIKGNTDLLGGDLDYTLRAFPNHHRALATLVRVALRDKTVQLEKTKYPVECYFDRAHRLAPDDGIAWGIYGTYLYGVGRYDEALAIYKQALSLAPDDPAINYNLGLAYAKKKDFAKANEYAHKAYELGYPLPGLKNQLVKAGKWTDKVQ